MNTCICVGSLCFLVVPALVTIYGSVQIAVAVSAKRCARGLATQYNLKMILL